jgi:HK97 family phage major capsid protein
MATLDELRAHIAEVKTEVQNLDAEFAGRSFDEDAQARYDALKDERGKAEAELAHLEERERYLLTLADNPGNTEDEARYAFQAKRPGRIVPDDPTRIEDYRASSLEKQHEAYRDGAMKVLETHFRPADDRISLEQAQENVSRMLDTIDHAVTNVGTRALAQRVIRTSSKEYVREFGRYLSSGGNEVGPEMTRAASLTVGSGGYAVPVSLDPTVILVSSGVINPIRQIARVERTTLNTLEFITSTGITATYTAEATETTDGAPALVQPVANLEKAQAFVPMSIEIFEDWAGIQTQMARMFADAKDRLENTQFLIGLGHASNVPQGLIAVGGATAVISSASTATLAVADIYALETALDPRWQANASIVGNNAAFQRVRQFDTAGGANLWVQLQDSNPPTLIGYPAYKWSAYSSAVTTTGSTVLTIGDFNQFLIADRTGMSVELIPHLFGGSNRFPTGQRGLYMYWRNTSKVLTPGTLANSAFVSLKLL